MKTKINWVVVLLIVAGALLLTVYSCNNTKKKNLANEINTISVDIEEAQQRISNLKDGEENISSQLLEQEEVYRSIKDSTAFYIKDSPAASAYIYQSELQLYDVLKQYADAATDEDRQALFMTQVFLGWYASTEYGRTNIQLLKDRLGRLNGQFVSCAANTRSLQQRLNAIKDESLAAQQNLDLLTQSKAEKQHQLDNISFFDI